MSGLDGSPAVLVLLLTEYSHLELQELVATKPDERPPLIIVGSTADANVMRLAMQAGARDFLPKLDYAEILASVRKIIRETGDSPGEQRLISFVSGKGGSGGTFLAANYAHLLCDNHQYSTLLMDLDRQFVDLPQYLGVNPEASLLDALRIVDELDEMAISAFISKHNSGLSLASHKVADVLTGPDIVPFDEQHGIDRFVEIARRKFTHIVAEVPRYLDALGARYLELSDQIVVVMQQNVPSVRDTLELHCWSIDMGILPP
jgi:pilus assembly protein CpaE